jgi:hypothetical protein
MRFCAIALACFFLVAVAASVEGQCRGPACRVPVVAKKKSAPVPFYRIRARNWRR